MTELEALNLMLTAADEDMVQTASVQGHLPLTTAKAVLNDVVRVVLSMGWAFNTEYKFPLSRDVDGKITLAGNMLSVDVDDTFTDMDPIQRGTVLYDRKAHSYVFNKDLTATVILLLSWDELPQPVRYYIAVRASRAYQVRMQSGEAVFKYTEQDEAMALAALSSFEADSSDANFLTDSWTCASVLQYRQN